MIDDITYIPNFFDKQEADILFDHLMNENVVNWQIPTRNDGKPPKSRRKMAYMAEQVSDYNYADMNLKGQEFTATVRFYMLLVNLENQIYCNSVLLNLYLDGKSEIRWHSDKEESLGENPIIPTLNLGATRRFWFRDKENIGNEHYYDLNHGDLLIMGPNCQKKYLHAVLKQPEIKEPRISLTFRRVYSLAERA